ncbi:hypothetical protein [Nostoc sp.]
MESVVFNSDRNMKIPNKALSVFLLKRGEVAIAPHSSTLKQQLI